MSESAFFTSGDGCRIAYRVDGPSELPVLVLSNSIATNFHMWDRQVEQFTRRFRLLRYDTRGHGCSDAPVGAYSLDRLGRDVLELLDSLDLARVHFCGLSLGGYVGQWLGIYAPDRIDRLILSNTSPYLGPAPQWDELIRKTLIETDMSATAKRFLGNWFPPSMLETPSEIVEAFRTMILETSPLGLAGCFAVVRDADLRRTIALIDRPTLVIGGQDDKVTLASHSEAIASTIPNAELHMMPGVHLLNIEMPVEFARTVTEFLLR